MDYIAYLHEDRKSDFGVSFPDFPGALPLEELWNKCGAERQKPSAFI